MPSYNYEIAKGALNENDKDRILCIYLSSDQNGAVDWAKASKDFGSASVESFKKTTQNMLKKIEKAGGLAEGSVSPVKAAPAKKRKAAAAEEGEEKPKKQGRKTKKEREAEEAAAAAAAAENGDDDDEAGVGAVKEEDGDGLL